MSVVRKRGTVVNSVFFFLMDLLCVRGFLERRREGGREGGREGEERECV